MKASLPFVRMCDPARLDLAMDEEGSTINPELYIVYRTDVRRHFWTKIDFTRIFITFAKINRFQN